MKDNIKIAVCGHGRHGKGTASQMIADATGMRYVEPTSLAASRIVFDEWGYNFYETPIKCYCDRHINRDLWYKTIRKYNQSDGSGFRLYADMADRNDIIDGIRRREELQACRDAGIVDFVIWVDATTRQPEDPTCEIRPEDCDFMLDNNGTIEQLRTQVDTLAAIGFAVDKLTKQRKADNETEN